MINETELKEALIDEYKKRNSRLAADLKIANQALHAADRKIEELQKDAQLLSALLFVALEGHNIRIDQRMQKKITEQIDAGRAPEFSENPSGQAILTWKR